MHQRRLAALVILSGSVLLARSADIEILRDRWGVPHIYASDTDDLFYAQGFMAAKDRLFQLDVWRRQNTGHLAEILGPTAIARDRLARLVRYRGDWQAEWSSYAPDAQRIATEFVAGINAFIRSLNGKRLPEFQLAGYDPEPWKPEDITGRIAGLLMTHNARTEVDRARDIQRFGLDRVQQLLPPDPFIRIEIPKGLDLSLITESILADYKAAIAMPQFNIPDAAPGEQGSNNWVVDGSLTATGKPILANDPHRPVMLPSLRKTWHLVAPGIDVFGAGEPALPGVALGHNDRIAWGFTIVGTDQQDIYVEKVNPENPNQYLYRGTWRNFEIEHDSIKVKGQSQPAAVELRYTIHGPVIHEDPAKHVAYALKWVGADPGSAGYLAALSLMRAKNWDEFLKGVEHYKIPSENLVYADVDGNIGWIAAGLAPVRKNWSGLLPVPGDTGEFEWSGYLPASELPQSYNPARHFIATANNNLLPKGYPHQLSFEWALPFRYQRIDDVLSSRKGWNRVDFEELQQDVVSIPAQRFVQVLRGWTIPKDSPEAEIVQKMVTWDGRMRVDSEQALIYAVWIQKMTRTLFGADLATRVNLETVLRTLERDPQPALLKSSLDETLAQLGTQFPDHVWRWGRLHQITFRHPLGKDEWSRGPIGRPGDATTVNATSGTHFLQTNGASYRQIIDLGDWDRSVMTNVPGEVGNPDSPYYDDLIEGWNYGVYHAMPYSRAAVQAAAVQRFLLRRR